MVVVKENEQIRLAVKDGQRPDLSVITGPETLTPVLVDVISRCWHQNPEERPTFSGMNCITLFQVSLQVTMCKKRVCLLHNLTNLKKNLLADCLGNRLQSTFLDRNPDGTRGQACHYIVV